jgi:hypothetical protein
MADCQPEQGQDVKRWTIRICECGCVHDRPNAGCPECGSVIAKDALEVIPADSPNVLSKEEARLAVTAINFLGHRKTPEYRAVAQRLSDYAEESADDA